MNYPNDYIYDYVYKFDIPTDKLKNKKVLFTFGDSWTNTRYLTNPKTHWPYLLKKKLNYDYVVSISDNYDSNYEIFDTIKKVLCKEEFPMKKQSYLNELKEFKVVVEWSTPMRDNTSVAQMYSPWNLATIPDLNSKEPNTKLWLDYVDKWFRVEMYSYDTQKRILFLQEFFNHNKIDWTMFMGFTPLVEKQFQDTEYDLRKWIDKKRFLFLNGFPNNMQDYLITCIDENFKDDIHINEMQFENNRLKYFGKNSDGVFTNDGHPDIKGLKYMTNLIYRSFFDAIS
jgi:hypothetical protein